ncbi:MAG: ABC transporter ATP-binding protein [Tissierellia bacterium]|nr:ABC transporter ATP-binding protein [Tissierellia bacterium]
MKKFLKRESLFLILSVIIIFVYTVLNIYLAFIFKDILNIVTSKDFSEFKITLLKAVITILFLAFADFAKNSINKSIQNKIDLEYSKEIYQNIIKNANIEKNSGSIISTLSNEIQMAVKSYIQTIFNITENSMLLVFALISLAIVDIQMTIIVFTLSVILTIFPKVFQKYLIEKTETKANQLAIYNGELSNVFSGFETIKAFAIEDSSKDLMDSKIVSLENSIEDAKFAMGMANNIGMGITYIVQLFIIILAGAFIIKGKMEFGFLLAIGQLLYFVTSPIGQIINSLNNFNSNKIIVKRLSEIEINKKVYGVYKKYNFKDSVEFKDISFSYGEKSIFKNINLKFEKGKKYAILGSSGSGKSTLLKLLSNNLEPDCGKITIDEIEIKALNYESFHKLFQKLDQNTFIFKGSVRFNISLYDNFSEEEIIIALKKANIYEKIIELPNKLDSELSEFNELLSGGERQRLQIARALIRNRKIFLLDEITSNLDYENAMQIENTIANLDKTVIAIRHKIDESLKNYDQLIILRDKEFEIGDYNYFIKKYGAISKAL